jgi:4-amino-4-deoxy-L-arabinose transferase-like glycosyltransferase
MKRERYLLILTILLLGILHGWSLLRYPELNGDEPWVGSRTWSYLRTGVVFGPLEHGVMDLVPGYQQLFPKIPVLAQSLIMRFFQEPDLLGVRLASLAAGALVLACIYLIAGRLFDREAALIGVVLCGTSAPFLVSAHIGRPDIFSAALGAAALCSYFAGRDSGLVSGTWAGLLSVLAVEAHPHGIGFGIAIGADVLLTHGREFFRRPAFLGLLVGALCGAFIFYLWHVYPDPSGYAEINQLVFTRTHTPPLLTFDPAVIMEGVRVTFLLFLKVSWPLLPIVIWCYGTGATKDRQSARRALLLATTILLSHALFIRNKFFYYAIFFSLPIDIVAAGAISMAWKSRPAAGFRAAIALLMTLQIAPKLQMLIPDQSATFSRFSRQVSEEVRPGESVMAWQGFWFDLADHNYLSWENLIYFQRLYPGSGLEQAFLSQRPDVLIVDRHFEQFILPEASFVDRRNRYRQGPLASYLQDLSISREALDAVLSKYGSSPTIIDDPDFGRASIYHMAWPEGQPGR